MVGVAVRADDREHLAVAHRVEHARRVGARIDDDVLLIVAYDPDVDLVGARAAIGRRGRRELIDPSGHPGASFLVCLIPPTFLTTATLGRAGDAGEQGPVGDRKSTRLNSSHSSISY